MLRPLKRITLPMSGWQVDIPERLNYGEYQRMQDVLLNSASIEIKDSKTTKLGDMKLSGETIKIWNRTLLTESVKSIYRGDEQILAPAGGTYYDLVESMEVEDVEYIIAEASKVFQGTKKKPKT